MKDYFKIFSQVSVYELNEDFFKTIVLEDVDTSILLRTFSRIKFHKTQHEKNLPSVILESNTYQKILLLESKRYAAGYFVDEWPDRNEDPYSDNLHDEINSVIEMIENYKRCEVILKTELDTRENVPNKQQRKEIRQKKAQLAKSGSKSKNR